MDYGLEKPSLIERFVELIPLRYPLAALGWVVILGPVSFGLSEYLQNGTSPFYFPNPVNALLGSLLLYYLLMIARRVRQRVGAAEQSVTQIIAEGEQGYDSIFGRVTDNRSIILLSVILEVLAFISTLAGRTFSVKSGLDVLSQIILIVGFATLIWEYSVSSWGLHKLGSSHLRLKSFLEDRFMGGKAIGSLALSLTTAYLVGLALFFLDTATFLPVLSLPFAVFYGILLTFGVIMFFLPLNSLHEKMRTEKIRSANELNQRFLSVMSANSLSPGGGVQSRARNEDSIAELLHLKRLEMAERKLATTPTWPFDIQVIARLITIVLSVTAVLLSRFITDYLIQIGLKI